VDRASPSALVRQLQEICGDENVFWRPEDLLVSEYGAGFDRRPRTAAALPGTAEEVGAFVRAARAEGASIVPRGAGTGLSGGAEHADAIVVSTAWLVTGNPGSMPQLAAGLRSRGRADIPVLHMVEVLDRALSAR
jgi:hypothetical protein